MSGVEPFNKLVKLAARAFYDDITTKGDNQPKSGRSDNRGIAVVVLDALTRRQWVREEDLAKDLKLHSKQLRRTLRFFEEEKLVTRDHRKETAKGAKIYSAAVAATADALHGGRDGEEKIKLHTHSYCCLDYAQIYDVVRYRLHRMRKKLKDALDNKNTVQEYRCPKCGKKYTALDAARLVSFEDESFHCESCNGELVAESDKLADKDIGDGDDNDRRRRHEKLKEMLQKMEVELKPLIDHADKIKNLTAPEFGSLTEWERRNVHRLAHDPNSSDPSRSSMGVNGTPMPFVGDAKIEVSFSGAEEKGDNVNPDNSSTKVLPPWMIKEGMILTDKQRGEVKQESKMASTSGTLEQSDDKKTINQEDDVKKIQEEYAKAYYAALMQRGQQHEVAKKEPDLLHSSMSDSVNATLLERQVGVKNKRSDEDEGDDDVEWEEAPPEGETYKVDLNVQADASGDDDGGDDDGIDWEEG